jgi:hypothetical protein
MINLVGGILVFLLGSAAIMNETHNPLTALVGLVAVTLAAVCLWLAHEYIGSGPNHMA